MVEPTSTARETPSVPMVNFTIDVNLNIAPAKDPAASISAILALAARTAPKEATPKKPAPAANAEAPSIIVCYPARPLKIMEDGHRVDARELDVKHVALLFPDTGWMIGAHTLCRDGEKPFASQADTIAAAKASRLLGHDDWTLADDVVYERHVIDRRFYKPAADSNLYPRLLLTDWYWTSRTTPWSESAAFCVDLYYGVVYNYGRSYSGFGLACRRARQ